MINGNNFSDFQAFYQRITVDNPSTLKTDFETAKNSRNVHLMYQAYIFWLLNHKNSYASTAADLLEQLTIINDFVLTTSQAAVGASIYAGFINEHYKKTDKYLVDALPQAERQSRLGTFFSGSVNIASTIAFAGIGTLMLLDPTGILKIAVMAVTIVAAAATVLLTGATLLRNIFTRSKDLNTLNSQMAAESPRALRVHFDKAYKPLVEKNTSYFAPAAHVKYLDKKIAEKINVMALPENGLLTAINATTRCMLHLHYNKFYQTERSIDPSYASTQLVDYEVLKTNNGTDDTVDIRSLHRALAAKAR